MPVLRPIRIRDVTVYSTMIKHIKPTKIASLSFINTGTHARTHSRVHLFDYDQQRNMDYNSALHAIACFLILCVLK